MSSIKIRLKTLDCEKCHARFEDGNVICRFGEIEKYYCKSCANIIENITQHLYIPDDDPHNSSRTRIDYIVEKDEGRLRLDSALEMLEDGIYEVKRIGMRLALNAAADGNTSVDEFMSSEGNYLFVKHNTCFLLFLHPAHFMKHAVKRADFYDPQTEYYFIRKYFRHRPWFGEAYWLYNSQDRLVGIGNVREADFTPPFADNRLRIARTIPFKKQDKADMQVKPDMQNEASKRPKPDMQVKPENLVEVKELKEREIPREQDTPANSEDASPRQHGSQVFNGLSPKIMLDYCEERIQGQGIWLKRAVYQIYRYMECVQQGRDFHAENWILTAPSGSGKTEFYRTIKALFALYKIPIPVVCIDLSQITETGYKGDNVITIPRRILSAKPDSKGIAICFLDEADKKCIPSYSSNNTDVNAAVQANLLTLLEGCEMKVEVDDTEEDFDSNHTMFVLMGAFQSIRQQKQKKQLPGFMGFDSEPKNAGQKDDIDRVDDCFYEDLSLQDMIDFGMSEELAGRLVQVVNFHRLSDDAMLQLIRYKTQEISKDMGITIQMTEEAENAFLDISFGSLGIRRPMNMIKELVQNTVADIFFEGKFDIDHDRVIIDSTDSAHIEQAS